MHTHTHTCMHTHTQTHTHTTNTHTSVGRVGRRNLRSSVGQGGHDQNVNLFQRCVVLPAQLQHQVLPLGIEFIAIQPLHVLHVEAEELDDGVDIMGVSGQATEHRLLHGRGVEAFVEVASAWLDERKVLARALSVH